MEKSYDEAIETARREGFSDGISIKETTFTKIVERTCKRDAYEAALYWAKGEAVDKETILWWLKEKIDCHNEYLNELDVYYDYSRQSLQPRNDQKTIK